MKRLSADWSVYENDRLVIRWYNKVTRKVCFQGKRVKHSCTLPAAVRRVYVEKGTVAAVKLLREMTSLSIYEAFKVLNEARRY